MQRAVRTSRDLGLWSLGACMLGLTSCGGEESSTPAPPASTQDGDGSTDVGSRRAVDEILGGAGQHDAAGPGKWMRVDDLATRHLTPEQRAEYEKLEAIGYAQGVRDAVGKGVSIYDEARAEAGLNLYLSGHACEAALMEMDGTVLHRWSKEYFELWPDAPHQGHPGTEFWRRAHLLENGDLIAIYEGLGIARFDKESNVVWKSDVGAHHDLHLRDDGKLWVLTRAPRMIPWLHPDRPILEDFVSLLDEDGRELRRISLVDAFKDGPFAQLAFADRSRHGDIFHTNTLCLLEGRIADKLPAFKAGHILTSMNNLGTIAVLDPESGRIVWCIKGAGFGQHDPQILDNGHLLLFDNQARRSDSTEPGRSNILEMDPTKGSIEWAYRGGDERPFYSAFCGAVMRLDGGNTLITESNGGRAFEVTPDLEIVWEFTNPHRAGENGEYIAQLLDVVRLPEDFPRDWIQ